MKIDPADLVIEPLSRASTLPAKWHVDPRMLEIERELIFARNWQLVGRVDQVAQVGAYFTCEVADEPLIVVRGADGELHAFSNVCRHRAGPVAQGEGVRAGFRCLYHGWAYDLNGSLTGTPSFRGVEGFARDEVRLPAVRVDTWPPFVFVNIHPSSPSLGETLGDLPERLRRYRLSDLSFRFTQVYDIACNWKTYLGNSLECYHCPYVHSSTVYTEVNTAGHTIDATSLQWIAWTYRSTSKDGRTAKDRSGVEGSSAVSDSPSMLARPGLDRGDVPGFYRVFVFPNFSISLTPVFVSTLRALPVDAEHTRVVRDFYCEGPRTPDLDAFMSATDQYLRRVEGEDIAICEAVQKGLRSRYYARGRLSAQREQSVHFFEEHIRQSIASRARTVGPE